MRTKRQHRGFSLTEVLLAIGTLSIGMLFIAGTFLVGIHLSTIATERTIAAVAADEAFAKVRLIAGDPSCPISAAAFDSELRSFEQVVNAVRVAAGHSEISPGVFAYPSTTGDGTQKQYSWSALCRRVGPTARFVQVTVFVSRTVSSGPMPVPRPVAVSGTVGSNVLQITEAGKEGWINDGYTIVDNVTGHIYRVVERYAPPDDDRTILLDRDWRGRLDPGVVWVVPPAGGGRNPCIAIYQKVIGF